jgi:FtsP/CotA-like multicopper oxidase with cupredoxin domain
MWYHPHIHGSTSLQVASGMSGVIIIEDDPAVLADFPALREASKPAHEKVMVFNQLMYDRETGELPDFGTMSERVRKPPSGTTINGVIKPIIDINPGEVQRWRMLHSGYNTNLALYFDTHLEVKQIAVDGIMFKEARSIGSAHFAPGNRSDVLIKISDRFQGKPGTVIPIYSLDYLPECEYFPESKQCTQLGEVSERDIIAYVRVGSKSMKPAMTFPTRLPGPGIGHDDILPEQIVNLDSPRKTVFGIKLDVDPYQYVVNDKEFDADVISEKPLLGTREAWTFEAENFEHPFHIHINPFQVVEYGGVKLKTPIWKDVALVRQKAPYTSWKSDKVDIIQGGERAALSHGSALAYTYYRKYWGGFVLHCHILDHEDQGMMQRVNIVKNMEDSDLSQREKIRARALLGFDKKPGRIKR